MPTCSSPVGTNRYWPWRAAESPARDRRLDPRCRRARCRRRASSERLRASRHVRTVASSSARSLAVGNVVPLGLDEPIGLGVVPAFGLPMRRGPLGLAALLHLRSVELVQKVLEPIGNALAYHVVVSPVQNIAKPALVFAAQPSCGLSCWGVRLHCRLWPKRLLLGEFPPNRLLLRRFCPHWLRLYLYPRRDPLGRGPLWAHWSITSCKSIRSDLMELFSRNAVFAGNLMKHEREGTVSTSTAVANYLPYLRRYARALTG